MTLLHDGSFEGMLSAAAHALAHGMPEAVMAEDQWQPGLFADTERIETDAFSARTLAARLRDDVSRRTFKNVAYCWLSELPGSGLHAARYIGLALELGSRVDSYHAHDAVIAVHRIAGKVGGEIHRLCGLARFREMKDGTLFAPVKPDYNVVCPIALHFRRRLHNERWAVCDVGRGTGVRWTGASFEVVGLAAGAPLMDFDHAEGVFSDDEARWRPLWQAYFAAIAVRTRTNPRLQRQYMPRRYWPYLVEEPGSSRRLAPPGGRGRS